MQAYNRHMRIPLLLGALAWSAIACTEGVAPGSSTPSPPGPHCASPAPLYGMFDPRAPLYMVMYHDGVNPNDETARLEGVYGFTPKSVWTAVPGFAASLDDAVRDMMRCEPSV